MKTFVNKLILFLLIAVVTIVGTIALINNLVNKNASFKIDKVSSSIVLGHSHAECAYNDDYIKNTSNYAQSGESYLYTFIKARQLIKDNPTIEHIYVEFTNDQIKLNKNDWIWGDNYLSDKYPKYAPFMTLKEQRLLLTHNFRGYMNVVSVATNKNLLKLINNKNDHTKIIGGYKALDHQLDLDKITESEIELAITTSKDSISVHNVLYLKKLIDYCKEKEKKITLIRSPLHRKNNDRKNEDTFQRIRLEYFKDVEFLDFIDFPLEDTDFADLEHLNSQGAIKFSAYIDNQFNP
ncbi:hypothetical protein [Psychroserpens luteolus]|uniref:hypothetical protein n=1 Tax=Psychroserpens luteolus TaxID=2855840 RepID=UPI001E393A73|nr:hypothetical protein [Psychroserpens luteolus]MCD2259803.1 hypothetical protein [Psychroserpens luteolus]